MSNDDEIVSEGISDFLLHESHGDLSFDITSPLHINYPSYGGQ